MKIFPAREDIDLMTRAVAERSEATPSILEPLRFRPD